MLGHATEENEGALDIDVVESERIFGRHLKRLRAEFISDIDRVIWI